eukprot:217225_1
MNQHNSIPTNSHQKSIQRTPIIQPSHPQPFTPHVMQQNVSPNQWIQDNLSLSHPYNHGIYYQVNDGDALMTEILDKRFIYDYEPWENIACKDATKKNCTN